MLWYISGHHSQIVYGASVCCVWQKKFNFKYPYRCHFSCISAIFSEYHWILKNLSIFLDKISYSSLKKFWNLRMWFTNLFAYCCPDLNTTSKTFMILWNQIILSINIEVLLCLNIRTFCIVMFKYKDILYCDV